MAARQGNADCSRSSRGCCNPWNNLKRNRRGGERGDLLGGAAEDQRVSALESNDAAIRARMPDHQVVNLFLGDALLPATLAYIDDLGIRFRECEDRRGHK